MLTDYTGQKNYGFDIVGSNSLLHQGGRAKLYFVKKPGEIRLIWPAWVGTEAIAQELILFNGGDTDNRIGFLVPIFAFAGKGEVVEITQPLIRLVAACSEGITNLSFRVDSPVTNGVFKLIAFEKDSAGDTTRNRFPIELSKSNLISIVETAQTNSVPAKYDGVSYRKSK